MQSLSANANSHIEEHNKLQLQINTLQSELTNSAANSKETINNLNFQLKTVTERVESVSHNSSFNHQINTLQAQLHEKQILLEHRDSDTSVSQRATEIATRALEEQIIKARNEQMSERESILQEKEMRQKAEREVSQLRRDMEFLAKSSVEGVEEMLKKAREDERSTCEVRNKRDLEALKIHTKTLKDEMELAKERERLAEERLGSETLRVSVLERELSGLKSDEQHLIDSKDRMKERNEEVRSERAKRASCSNTRRGNHDTRFASVRCRFL